jgi:hypothetical protein
MLSASHIGHRSIEMRSDTTDESDSRLLSISLSMQLPIPIFEQLSNQLLGLNHAPCNGRRNLCVSAASFACKRISMRSPRCAWARLMLRIREKVGASGWTYPDDPSHALALCFMPHSLCSTVEGERRSGSSEKRHKPAVVRPELMRWSLPAGRCMLLVALTQLAQQSVQPDRREDAAPG